MAIGDALKRAKNAAQGEERKEDVVAPDNTPQQEVEAQPPAEDAEQPAQERQGGGIQALKRVAQRAGQDPQESTQKTPPEGRRISAFSNAAKKAGLIDDTIDTEDPVEDADMEMPQDDGAEYNVMDNFDEILIEGESGGDNFAVSATGAAGLYQFTVGTAREMGLVVDPEMAQITYALGRNEISVPEAKKRFKQLLSQGYVDERFDPDRSKQAYERLKAQNADYLQLHGIPVTGATLYGAHNVGAGSIKRIYEATQSGDYRGLTNRDLKNVGYQKGLAGEGGEQDVISGYWENIEKRYGGRHINPDNIQSNQSEIQPPIIDDKTGSKIYYDINGNSHTEEEVANTFGLSYDVDENGRVYVKDTGATLSKFDTGEEVDLPLDSTALQELNRTFENIVDKTAISVLGGLPAGVPNPLGEIVKSLSHDLILEDSGRRLLRNSLAFQEVIEDDEGIVNFVQKYWNQGDFQNIVDLNLDIAARSGNKEHFRYALRLANEGEENLSEMINEEGFMLKALGGVVGFGNFMAEQLAQRAVGSAAGAAAGSIAGPKGATLGAAKGASYGGNAAVFNYIARRGRGSYLKNAVEQGADPDEVVGSDVSKAISEAAGLAYAGIGMVQLRHLTGGAPFKRVMPGLMAKTQGGLSAARPVSNLLGKLTIGGKQLPKGVRDYVGNVMAASAEEFFQESSIQAAVELAGKELESMDANDMATALGNLYNVGSEAFKSSLVTFGIWNSVGAISGSASDFVASSRAKTQDAVSNLEGYTPEQQAKYNEQIIELAQENNIINASDGTEVSEAIAARNIDSIRKESARRGVSLEEVIKDRTDETAEGVVTKNLNINDVVIPSAKNELLRDTEQTAITDEKQVDTTPEDVAVEDLGETQQEQKPIAEQVDVLDKDVIDETVTDDDAIQGIEEAVTKPAAEKVTEPAVKQVDEVTNIVGYDVRPVNIRVKGELAKKYEVVETESGTGNPLFNTVEEARQYIEKRNKVVAANRKFAEKERARVEAREAKEAEFRRDLDEYASNLDNLSKGRVKKTLSAQRRIGVADGKDYVGARHKVIENALADGWKVESYTLSNGKKGYLIGRGEDGAKTVITKTEYEYGKYLEDKKGFGTDAQEVVEKRKDIETKRPAAKDDAQAKAEKPKQKSRRDQIELTKKAKDRGAFISEKDGKLFYHSTSTDKALVAEIVEVMPEGWGVVPGGSAPVGHVLINSGSPLSPGYQKAIVKKSAIVEGKKPKSKPKQKRMTIDLGRKPKSSRDVPMFTQNLKKAFPITSDARIEFVDMNEGQTGQIDVTDNVANIKINKNVSSAEQVRTLLHESIGHYGLEVLMKNNQKVYDNVKSVFKQSKNTDLYKAVKELYPDLKGDRLFSEWFSYSVERIAQDGLDKNGNKIGFLKDGNLKNPLVQVYKRVKQFLHSLLSPLSRFSQKRRDRVIQDAIVSLADTKKERVRAVRDVSAKRKAMAKTKKRPVDKEKTEKAREKAIDVSRKRTMKQISDLGVYLDMDVKPYLESSGIKSAEDATRKRVADFYRNLSSEVLKGDNIANRAQKAALLARGFQEDIRALEGLSANLSKKGKGSGAIKKAVQSGNELRRMLTGVGVNKVAVDDFISIAPEIAALRSDYENLIRKLNVGVDSDKTADELQKSARDALKEFGLSEDANLQISIDKIVDGDTRSFESVITRASKIRAERLENKQMFSEINEVAAEIDAGKWGSVSPAARHHLQDLYARYNKYLKDYENKAIEAVTESEKARLAEGDVDGAFIAKVNNEGLSIRGVIGEARASKILTEANSDYVENIGEDLNRILAQRAMEVLYEERVTNSVMGDLFTKMKEPTITHEGENYTYNAFNKTWNNKTTGNEVTNMDLHIVLDKKAYKNRLVDKGFVGRGKNFFKTAYYRAIDPVTAIDMLDLKGTVIEKTLFRDLVDGENNTNTAVQNYYSSFQKNRFNDMTRGEYDEAVFEFFTGSLGSDESTLRQAFGDIGHKKIEKAAFGKHKRFAIKKRNLLEEYTRDIEGVSVEAAKGSNKGLFKSASSAHRFVINGIPKKGSQTTVDMSINEALNMYNQAWTAGGGDAKKGAEMISNDGIVVESAGGGVTGHFYPTPEQIVGLGRAVKESYPSVWAASNHFIKAVNNEKLQNKANSVAQRVMGDRVFNLENYYVTTRYNKKTHVPLNKSISNDQSAQISTVSYDTVLSAKDRGFMMSRESGADSPYLVRDALNTEDSYMKALYKFVYLAEQIDSAENMLDYTKESFEKMGIGEYTQVFDRNVKALRGKVSDPISKTSENLDRYLGNIMSKFALTRLTQVGTMLKQLPSFAHVMLETSPEHWGAMFGALSNVKETGLKDMDNYGILQMRKTYIPDSGLKAATQSKAYVVASHLTGHKKPLSRLMQSSVGFADRSVMRALYAGKRAELISEGYSPNSRSFFEEMNRRMSDIILTSQPDGSVMGRNDFRLSDNILMKSLTMFSSLRMKMGLQIVRSTNDVLYGDSARKAQGIKRFGTIVATNMVMNALINRLMSSSRGYTDDEEEFADWFFTSMLRDAFGLIPVAGSFIDHAASKMFKYDTFDPSITPFQLVVEGAGSVGTLPYNIKEFSTTEFDNYADRTNKSIELMFEEIARTAYVMGVPIGSLEGLTAVHRYLNFARDIKGLPIIKGISEKIGGTAEDGVLGTINEVFSHQESPYGSFRNIEFSKMLEKD